MAETVALKIKVDTGGSEKTLGQLESRAGELNEEMRKIPLGSKAFKEMKQELIGVNKEIKNTELSMEALDNEQVASELGSVAGAVGDMTAAFVLLGGGGGALEETAANIEKALGISMAFKGAIEGVISFQKLWNSTLKKTSVIQGILTAAQWVYTTAIVGTTVAVKLLRIALISTGIGALITGVVLLIANFGKLINIVGSFFSSNYKANQERIKQLKQAQEELKKIIALRKEAIKQNLKESGDSNKITQNIIKAGNKKIALAQAEGKSKREILKLQKEERRNALIGAEQALEQHRKTELSLLGISLQLKKNTKLYDDMNKADQEAFLEKSKAHQEQVKQLEALQKEARKVRDDARHEEKIAQAEARASRKETRKERAKLEKQAIFDLQVAQKQAIFDLQVAQKQADAEDILDEQKKAEALIEIERFKHEKELENKKLTNAEKELLEFEYQQRIADISQEFVDAEFEREQAEKERLAEIKKKAEEDKKEAKKEEEVQAEIDKDKRIAREKEVQDAKFDLALGGIDALIQLNNAFQGQTEAQQKRGFERNKKLQIAQALIQTYQSANAIFASSAANPITIGFPAYPSIMAGIAIASGLANVANISKQQFSGGTIGGGAPNFNVSGGGQAPQLSPITNTSTLVPQEAQQVFVTETDITQTQNKVAVIEEQATIK